MRLTMPLRLTLSVLCLLWAAWLAMPLAQAQAASAPAPAASTPRRISTAQMGLDFCRMMLSGWCARLMAVS